MTKINSLLKTKMSKLIRIIAILLIALSINSNLHAQENNSKLEVSLNHSYNRKYMPFGYVNGKGPHEQTTLNLKYQNFTGFVWSDYDFGDKETIEKDYGIGYSKVLSDKVSVSGNFFVWKYLSNGLDRSLNATINYKNKFNANASYYYIFPNKEVSSGQVLNLNVTKNFDLGKKVTITPKLETNLLYKTFGGDTGISNIDGSITLDYELKNITFSGFIGEQLGFKEKTVSKTPINNQLYVGGSINISF